MTFSPPEFKKKAFTCPHCEAYSAQYWIGIFTREAHNSYTIDSHLDKSLCHCCGKEGIWVDKKLVTPEATPAPVPHIEMPADCRDDFLEARSIISRSSRGAAALFRLIVQKLMPHLGESGKDLNSDIASLVEKGLPVEVQQALDACRVIGNEAVHPGEMDIRDNPEIAIKMCELVNFIVDNRIAHPKRIHAIYSGIPAGKQEAIAKRDNKSS